MVTSCVTLLCFTDLLTNLMMNLIIYKRPRIEFNKATTHNSFLVVVLGDFNAKSCNWCINDKANFEGAKTDTLTSQNGLHQIIKEHIFLIHHSLALTYFYITTYVSYEFWYACFFTCELSSSDQFQYITFHSMEELCDIISMQTRIISEKLCATSIGKGLLQIKM